ncbi:class III lanthionine synthetase LanKC [Streptomyces sp. NPDC004111]|uniref:class III lanthionine synthetase LanKC n=1 Tax=Streptomyces sp. NPDC004111 TaxID=3364690 RepID=UPI003697A269
MDIRYPMYCVAHPRYYEAPEFASYEGGPDFAALAAPPRSWRVRATGPWRHLGPTGAALPDQGWKIHVTATPGNAPHTLEKTARYCFDHALSFKHLRNPRVLLQHNTKYAPRAASGKFLTVYPRDEAELERVTLDLDAVLAGGEGPYILSDLRWRQGPVYLRYGSFTERYVTTAHGARTPALRAPDGTLVPDRRLPRFVLPDWVTPPAFLREAVTARGRTEPPGNFPYTAITPLHFSNGGGVYRAEKHPGGEPVVLKEARPHAGLDRQGRDAVARLRSEENVLRALAGLPGVPRVRGHHTAGGHYFLAQERMPGVSFHTWLTIHHPARSLPGDPATTAYQHQVRTVLDQVEDLIRQIHARGWVYRDLHPGNVLVDDDLTVSLVDHEIATPAADPEPRAMGAAGFAAPDDVHGPDEDRYALAGLQLFAYLPLNSLLALAPGKGAVFARYVRTRYPLAPRELARLEPLYRHLDGDARLDTRLRDGDFHDAEDSWAGTRRALTASLLASATPEREDRLFPGDIAQFEGRALGYAHGAAGVLDTLHQEGAEIPAGHVRWMVCQAQRNTSPALGLYDGLSGVVHTLARLGSPGEARDLFAPCLTGTVRSAKLYDGLAGTGLVALQLLHHDHADTALRDFADRTAAELRTAVHRGTYLTGTAAAAPAPGAAGPGNAPEHFRAGLLHGWSGTALFLLHHYEATADTASLRAARAALDHDLAQCRPAGPDTLLVRNHNRLLPYLATGGAGIALVADHYLRHRPGDDELRGAVPRLLRGAQHDATICAGLFNGRAGLVYALDRLARYLPEPERTPARTAPGVPSLTLHALRDEHGLVLPGDQNLRLSMDVATGSAGVLRLLRSLAAPDTPLLPFLPVPGTAGGRTGRTTSSDR